MLNSINLKNHPELVRLLEQGETINDLLKLPPDQLLLRWFNYHLTRAKHKKINNFSSDVKDSDAYTTLLHQIAPNMCSLQPLEEKDVNKRATAVIGNAGKLGVKSAVKNTDISSGNPRLNLIFTAAIFNTCPGLEPLTQEEVKKCGLLEDDFGDSREERAFRMWINSLGIEDLHVNSLYEDCKDGVVLLKVIDHVVPGTVSWKKVNNPALTHFKRLENDNYAVLLGKTLKFSLVNIAGSDIADGNKKLLLGLVWQLMRLHCLRFLANLAAKKFGGKQVTDDQLVNYANELVSKGGRSSRMKSFSDPTLATGMFFLDLMHVINPKMIDWDIVQAGENKEQQLNNAKYCISVARKLGATIFLLPEDIVDVKQKMILTFVAALLAIAPC
jgi:plastin-1